MGRSKIGYCEGRAYDGSRLNWSDDGSRPIVWSAWYPASHDAVEQVVAVPAADPHFIMGTVARDAALREGCERFPVVLLSHGTGGTASSLGWMAEALARAGYVVIGVDHHGNTASETYRAEGFLCWWERSQDLSVALDIVESESIFVGRLETARVACLGFSLGGYTALSILGAITDMDRFGRWAGSSQLGLGPREFPDLGDRIEPLRGDNAVFRSSWERQSASCLDPRVVVAVAPGPAPTVRAFTPTSLAGIAASVTLMAGEADQEAPVAPCAAWLNGQLPKSELHSLGRDVGHYTLLCGGTREGRECEPEIWIDAPTLDRRDVHRRAVGIALAAIGADLPAMIVR